MNYYSWIDSEEAEKVCTGGTGDDGDGGTINIATEISNNGYYSVPVGNNIVENIVFDTTSSLIEIGNYINGQYTYNYYDDIGGWSVGLTDRESTDPVTTNNLCTTVNNQPIVSMSGMFEKSSVTTIDLNGIDTSNVTDMSHMFYESHATTLDLSSFDTSNVTDMHSMFYGSAATTLDLSSFDTSNVRRMEGMFRFATNLTTIYVSSNFTTNSVTDSGLMFSGASNLVGGNGTTYNASYVNKVRAVIDTASTPGYFTDIADKPSS